MLTSMFAWGYCCTWPGLLAHGTSSIGFDTAARTLGPSMRRPVWQGLKQFQAAINVYYNAGILQPMPGYSHIQPLGITVRVLSQPDFNHDQGPK